MSDFVSFKGADDPAYVDSVRQFAARRGVYATTHDVAALGRDLYALTPADGRWESAEAMSRRLPVALGDALDGYRDGYGRCCFRLPRPYDLDDDGAFTPGDVDELSEARFEDWAAALASVRAFVERTTGNSAATAGDAQSHTAVSPTRPQRRSVGTPVNLRRSDNRPGSRKTHPRASRRPSRPHRQQLTPPTTPPGTPNQGFRPPRQNPC